MNFIENHLITIIVCTIFLLLLPLIFRFLLKMALILIVITVIGSMVFGPKFIDVLQNPFTATQEFAQTKIQPVIEDELQNAVFNYDPLSKKYVIKSSSFTIEGSSNQEKAVVIFNDKKYTINASFLNSFMKNQIEKQTAQKQLDI